MKIAKRKDEIVPDFHHSRRKRYFLSKVCTISYSVLQNEKSIRDLTVIQFNNYLCEGTFDFFALNHYTSLSCSPSSVDASFFNSYYEDLQMQHSEDEKWPKSRSSWLKVYKIQFPIIKNVNFDFV